MSESASFSLESTGRTALAGQITFETAGDLYRRLHPAFKRTDGECTVDLARVTSVDSSALALLLEWRAQHGEGGFRVVNAPAGLLRLARLCEADELLDLGERPDSV